MKSYGRAPSFLAMTGFEQVRSIVAEVAGDHEAAARVELVLPDTGVCGGSGLFDGRPAESRLLRPRDRAAHHRRAADLTTTPAALDGGALRRVAAVLCLLEVVAWGALFYAFPVLASEIARAEGRPLRGLVAVFTGAQLVAVAVALSAVGGRALVRARPARRAPAPVRRARCRPP